MENEKNEYPPGLICIKDIVRITQRSPRTARRIAKAIKKETNCRYVSIEAFCKYTGLSFATVGFILKNQK